MAGWLKPGGRRRRSGWPLAAIAIAVLLSHGWLGLALRQQLGQDRDPAEAPPRLTAAFVRELVERRPLRSAAPRPAAAKTLAPPHGAALTEPPLSLDPLLPLPDIAELPALPVASEATEPGPEWPASTQLSYSLNGHYRGEVQGQAQVQWLRQGRHYQVHLEVAVGPGFAPLITRRMSSDGLLTPQGIAPQRYDEDTRVLLSERRRVTLAFEGQVLRLADGRPQPQPAGVQDAASQFVHLTWLFLTGRELLRPGLVVEMPLALPRRLYRWRYEVIGEETLQTPMGPLQAWHLRPHGDSPPRAGGDLRAEVWLAPSLQYLPVRLRISQDEASHIDLMLKSPPLQAAAP